MLQHLEIQEVCLLHFPVDKSVNERLVRLHTSLLKDSSPSFCTYVGYDCSTNYPPIALATSPYCFHPDRLFQYQSRQLDSAVMAHNPEVSVAVLVFYCHPPVTANSMA